ncbi:MAG: hypothetical protein QXR60_03815 [Candidatus Nanoarchaeia archaeon]
MAKCRLCGSKKFIVFKIGHSQKKYKKLMHKPSCKKYVPIRNSKNRLADPIGDGEGNGVEDGEV